MSVNSYFVMNNRIAFILIHKNRNKLIDDFMNSLIEKLKERL